MAIFSVRPSTLALGSSCGLNDLSVCSPAILEKVDNQDGHVVASNSVILAHFFESVRTDGVKEVVIWVLNFLESSPVGGQSLFVVGNYLLGGLAVPDSVAGEHHEFHVLMEWLHHYVGVRSDHVVVQEPARLGVLGWGDWFVVKVTHRS